MPTRPFRRIRSPIATVGPPAGSRTRIAPELSCTTTRRVSGSMNPGVVVTVASTVASVAGCFLAAAIVDTAASPGGSLASGLSVPSAPSSAAGPPPASVARTTTSAASRGQIRYPSAAPDRVQRWPAIPVACSRAPFLTPVAQGCQQETVNVPWESDRTRVAEPDVARVTRETTPEDRTRSPSTDSPRSEEPTLRDAGSSSTPAIRTSLAIDTLTCSAPERDASFPVAVTRSPRARMGASRVGSRTRIPPVRVLHGDRPQVQDRAGLRRHHALDRHARSDAEPACGTDRSRLRLGAGRRRARARARRRTGGGGWGWAWATGLGLGDGVGEGDGLGLGVGSGSTTTSERSRT